MGFLSSSAERRRKRAETAFRGDYARLRALVDDGRDLLGSFEETKHVEEERAVIARAEETLEDRFFSLVAAGAIDEQLERIPKMLERVLELSRAHDLRGDTYNTNPRGKVHRTMHRLEEKNGYGLFDAEVRSQVQDFENTRYDDVYEPLTRIEDYLTERCERHLRDAATLDSLFAGDLSHLETMHETILEHLAPVKEANERLEHLAARMAEDADPAEDVELFLRNDEALQSIYRAR